MPSINIFVYGTLKPGERAYSYFCQPYVTDAQLAMTPGRIYSLPMGYPAMTLEPGWVQGFVLRFGDASVLQAMDEFEEYYPDNPEASVYQRVLLPVFSLSQEPLGQAWGYVMEPPQVRKLQGEYLLAGVWHDDSGE